MYPTDGWGECPWFSIYRKILNPKKQSRSDDQRACTLAFETKVDTPGSRNPLEPNTYIYIYMILLVYIYICVLAEHISAKYMYMMNNIYIT